MIRVVSIVSLTSLLALVLYLPSVHAPERFVEQMRLEHEMMARLWATEHADRILARTLDTQTTTDAWSPMPRPASAPASPVGHEMTAVNARLFGSPYFKSVDALLALATFRLYTLIEWVPWVLPFGIAACLDGSVVRRTRAKLLLHQDPQIMALFACLGITSACVVMIGLVLPIDVHPLVLPIVLLFLSGLVGAALAELHYRE